MRYQIRFVALLYTLFLPLLTHASSPSVHGLVRKTLAATVSLEMQDENGNALGQRSGFSVRPNSPPPTFTSLYFALIGVPSYKGRDLEIAPTEDAISDSAEYK